MQLTISVVMMLPLWAALIKMLHLWVGLNKFKYKLYHGVKVYMGYIRRSKEGEYVYKPIYTETPLYV